MVPGVADINHHRRPGQTVRSQSQPGQTQVLQLTLQQLYTALGRGNANAGGNYVNQGEQQYLIRGIGLLRSPEDIGGHRSSSHNGTAIRVKDVAEVTVSSVPRQGVVGQDENDDVVNGNSPDAQRRKPSDVLVGVSKSRVVEQIHFAQGRANPAVL